jgi:hypothetical protein
MSVSLYNKSEINSLVKTYAENEDEQRAIWYAYVSNVTAYNLQYQQYEQIDFQTNEFSNIGMGTLGGLHYNIATNDGNTFMQHKWYKIFKEILDRTNKLDDYEQEHLAGIYNTRKEKSLNE